MSKRFEEFSRKYFSVLAERIFLSPSNEVLDMCVGYVSKIQDDLQDLMSVDTENVEIFYNLSRFEMLLETPQPQPEVENQEILKSLLKSYELPNISIQKQSRC